MAGEIEAAGEPNASRNIQERAASPTEMLDPVDGLPESPSVERLPVRNSSEIDDGDGFGSAPHPHDPRARRRLRPLKGKYEERETHQEETTQHCYFLLIWPSVRRGPSTFSSNGKDPDDLQKSAA